MNDEIQDLRDIVQRQAALLKRAESALLDLREYKGIENGRSNCWCKDADRDNHEAKCDMVWKLTRELANDMP